MNGTTVPENLSGDFSRDKLSIKVYGPDALPTLVYLPGLHGDWTLVSSFRSAVVGKARFVEVTYPRNTTWSLDDYASNIRQELARLGVHSGWLLAESFGSQVGWAILACGEGTFKPQGVILAGGFVRHPTPWGVRLFRAVCAHHSPATLRFGLSAYARYARFRHRHAPETLECVREFARRRQEPIDQLAIQHRLSLISANDPRATAAATHLPVYALAGLVDPLVPTPWVWSWLRQNCPGFRGRRLILNADHNVLGTAPRKSAEQILDWVSNGAQ
jgi:pimeloyl-ACP methyl ester carboxylesterase